MSNSFTFAFSGRRYTATVHPDGDEIVNIFDHGEGRILSHLDGSCRCGCDDDSRHYERPTVWRAALGLIDA